MAKQSTTYQCSECGWVSPKWQGQCRMCKNWGCIEEVSPVQNSYTKAMSPAKQAMPITEIDIEQSSSTSSGVGELDRVLGSGIVAGAVILLAGEPGVGKSTLLMEVTLKAAKANPNSAILYVSGEESASQVAGRAKRIGELRDNLMLASENDLSVILGHIEQVDPKLVIIDSIQTVQDPNTDAGIGSTVQVKTVASTLINVAKTRNIPIILIGHVTKDGTIAGPRVLEHLVDVVCHFEGDKHSRVRMLRAVKNRYGPTDEVGCFEIGESGIKELKDPSGLFMSENQVDTSGVCISIAMDGRRAMPFEIQSLVVSTKFASPRRVASGFDNSRLAMMLALIESRHGISYQSSDVYLASVGGAKIDDVALDLPCILAIVSAYLDRKISRDTVAVGEVGLTGDVRKVSGIKQRLQQAQQLGFSRAIVPQSCRKELEGFKLNLELVYVEKLSEAIAAVFA